MQKISWIDRMKDRVMLRVEEEKDIVHKIYKWEC